MCIVWVNAVQIYGSQASCVCQEYIKLAGNMGLIQVVKFEHGRCMLILVTTKHGRVAVYFPYLDFRVLRHC